MPAQPAQHDILRVLIAKDIARSAGATAGTLVTPSLIASGETVVTDLGLRILDTTTVLAEDQVMIVQGRGSTKNLLQVKVDVRDIRGYFGKAYSAKVQQVTYVGYDATTNTGSFDVINDNEYRLQVYMQDQTPSSLAGLFMPIIASYTSDATATEEEVATNLFKQLAIAVAQWNQRQVLVELVSSAAGTATNDAAVALTQYSTTVTAPNIAAASVAGDFIRIASQSTDTDEIYEIESISGNDLTLTVPYQDVDASATIYRVAAATAAAGDFGIRITGLNHTFEIDTRPYSLTSFQVSMINGGDTPQNTPTKAFLGHGEYEQVATWENASWGAVGQIFHYRTELPFLREADAVSTQDYSTLTFKTSRQVGETTSTKLSNDIVLCLSLDGNVASTFDTNIAGVTTSLVDVLDAWVSNLTSFTPQISNL
jgi:hypothetical protein